MRKLSTKRCENFKHGGPLRELLSKLTDKWSILVLISLSESELTRTRFSTLKRNIDGISQRMLTATLKNLERSGLVTRHAFPEVPPRVEYQLTKLGISLLTPLRELVDWLEDRWPEIAQAQSRYTKR